jgi:hypothetical protein
MAKAKKSETVPKTMQETFDRIVAITDEFASQHLNEEYAQLIRYATAALCRKRPSPLASGRDRTWACGISHAIGMVNFLFDSSQDPHIRASELYAWFGVSGSTGQAKSKIVRDTLNMHQLDPDWCLPSKIDDNPMAWLIMFNGYIIDARTAPRAVQEIAYAQGLIPYLPEPAAGTNATQVPSPSASPPTPPGSPNALYELEVSLLGGPVTDAFMAKNPVVSRRIEIKGSNTLADLHKIIFKAFNREEEHLYEFQVGGDRPQDPKAKRYGLKSSDYGMMSFPDEAEVADATQTRIADIGLVERMSFGYWFDFGDDWWHQIDVLSIQESAPKGKYPKITKREGASPPQYADF